MMPAYTCLCCGHTEEFDDADTAFKAGWDVAPRFSVQPLCPLCPAAPVALLGLEKAQARHAELHVVWARDGRPEEFDMEAELMLDVHTEEGRSKARAEIENLKWLFGGRRK